MVRQHIVFVSEFVRMADEVVAEKINQAITTGEQFSQRYYKILDQVCNGVNVLCAFVSIYICQERHTIDKMYHEEAVLAWNGKVGEKQK